MNGADYLIVGVLAISMLLGLVRGFVRESIALLAWLGGIWLAWRYAALLQPQLEGMPGGEIAQIWAARAIILISVLILGWLLASILAYMLRHSGLSIAVDRLLGMLFGVLRGAVVISVVILLAQFLQLEQTRWWKRSKLLPYATATAGWIQSFAETGMELLRQANPTPVPKASADYD
jgi:membrane protein required for colicin V production